jgi:hypothetical protein
VSSGLKYLISTNTVKHSRTSIMCDSWKRISIEKEIWLYKITTST